MYYRHFAIIIKALIKLCLKTLKIITMAVIKLKFRSFLGAAIIVLMPKINCNRSHESEFEIMFLTFQIYI